MLTERDINQLRAVCSHIIDQVSPELKEKLTENKREDPLGYYSLLYGLLCSDTGEKLEFLRNLPNSDLLSIGICAGLFIYHLDCQTEEDKNG